MLQRAATGERLGASASVLAAAPQERGPRRPGWGPAEDDRVAAGPPTGTGRRAGRLSGRRLNRLRRTSPARGLASPEIEVTEIPAGIWLRSARKRGIESPDGAATMPMIGRWPAIVVGAPGEPSPEVNACARFVKSLPDRRRANFGLIIYGCEAVSAWPFAQRLAERLRGPVHSYHGMPYYTASGARDESVVDSAGQGTWRPFIHSSIHRPGCSPVPCEWRCPAPELIPAGVGSYRLTAGWMVDLLASGLLLRPAGIVPDPGLGLIPPHPGHVNLVVAAAPPPTVLPAVQRMANSLPAAARSRLRLVATPEVEHVRLAEISRALQVEVHALGKTRPKSPLLLRRFVEPVGGIGEPQEVWGCDSCDTNNFEGNAVCRRCRRARGSTTSTNAGQAPRPCGSWPQNPATAR